ncbi:MAG TPA: DUF2249 domain-containing protein [Euryarchaeota archaeon]|nr:hypothetical protein BMS3Bbin15_01108 [archaeon BMS3Bbin15]HDL15693.1 DUF2249 domain-containing protein [Euryarchaeota archaeon]
MEILDVRGIPHSERPEIILRKLKELGKLEIFVEVKPVPVIVMLESKGYTCKATHDQGIWKVRITEK